MIDDDTFKAVLHEDEAFKLYLEREGGEHTRERLQGMVMRLSTQIGKFGDERPGWYKKAKGLLTVVRVRLDEVKDYEARECDIWKELAGDMAEALTLNYGDNFEEDIDYDDPESVRAFFNSTGI